MFIICWFLLFGGVFICLLLLIFGDCVCVGSKFVVKFMYIMKYFKWICKDILNKDEIMFLYMLDL